MILHRHQLGIALRGEGMKRGDQVQFVLAGEKSASMTFIGTLTSTSDFLEFCLSRTCTIRWLFCLATRTSQSLLWTVNKLAVLGGADSIDEGAEVDVIHVGVVNLDLAVMDAVLVDGGENLFGQFERDIDADGLALGVGTDDADMQPAVLRLRKSLIGWNYAGAAVACAKAPIGERRRAVVVMRAVLANKVPCKRSDMTGCLLAGVGPVLGDRYESPLNKVSENVCPPKARG